MIFPSIAVGRKSRRSQATSGGGEGTAMATLAASMSSGDIEEMTGTTGLDLFVGGPTSGFKTGWSDKMARDTDNKLLYWIGCDHNETSKFLKYDEETDAWTTAAASVPWGQSSNGVGTTAHGYEHSVFADGTLWHRPYGDRTLRRWDGGTSWTSFSYSSQLFYNAATVGFCWFPEISRFVIYQLENGSNGGLITYDPDTNDWDIIDNGTSALAGTGDPHCFAHYIPNKAVVVFGGGNSSDVCFKMDSSGVITQLDDFPAAITHTVGPAGTTDVSNPCALPFVNPVTDELIVVESATVAYSLNPNASVGSQWTSLGGILNSILTTQVYDSTSPYGCVFAPIEEYGVVAIVKAWSSASDAKMFLYKP